MIPNDIFRNCRQLLNISRLFSDFEFTNNGNVYQFPHPDLFKDCTSLVNISNLFYG
jgi:hypothetical protein